MDPVRNFNDFCSSVLACGFSAGAGRARRVFTVIPVDWDTPPDPGCPVRWFTGDPDTDPWEWRMRVLEERNDIAYAKLFLRSGGFISREWYPVFLACRRGGESFEEAYARGTVSHSARRIFDAIRERGSAAAPDIKAMAGFSGGDDARFESALIDLQMRMFITICGRRRKISRSGEPYGWDAMIFCAAEDFWDGDVLAEAAGIPADEAAGRIGERIRRLNPDAGEKDILKFITGR